MGKANKKKKLLSRLGMTSGKRRKTYLQVGALCFSDTDEGLRFLLITSRRTRRWIIPKGWTMKKLSKREAALREAWEEAGVEGHITGKAVGIYTYRKVIAQGVSIQCAVQTYPVEVRKLAGDFPEKGQRKIKWFKPKKAAHLISDPKLGQLIREFSKSYEAARAKNPTSEAAICAETDSPSIEDRSKVSLP